MLFDRSICSEYALYYTYSNCKKYNPDTVGAISLAVTAFDTDALEISSFVIWEMLVYANVRKEKN